MNILELLSNELKTVGQNFSLEEKKRYIYQRMCEIFSYDPQYYLYNINGVLENFIKAKEIFEYQPNLEKIEKTEVICSSWAYIYKNVLETLLGCNCYDVGVCHKKVEFPGTSIVSSADACGSSDLVRMKMNLSSYGYILQDKYNKDYLKQIDKNIDYIKNEYLDKYIKKIANSINNLNKTLDDSILFKINAIKTLYKKFPLINFNDYRFSIEYLILNLFSKEEYFTCFNCYTLVDIIPTINYYWLCVFDTYENEYYFILKPSKNTYTFEEITKSDAKEYCRCLVAKEKPKFYK